MAVDLAEITGAKAAAQIKQEKEIPSRELDRNAFMRLFLEQLKNQDPTAPMEVDKIITQTAQLTQVEMQEENKKVMKEVAEAMKSTKETNDSLKDFQKSLSKTLDKLDGGIEENIQSNSYLAQISALNAVSMIGKIVQTDINGIELPKEGDVNFMMYFDEPIQEGSLNGKIEIFDQDKKLVRSIPIESKQGEKGYVSFKWDGLDDAGERVKEGVYSIRAQYNLNPVTNQYLQTYLGRGEVDSVLFDKGKPMLKMGSLVVPMESVVGFYDKNSPPLEKQENLVVIPRNQSPEGSQVNLNSNEGIGPKNGEVDDEESKPNTLQKELSLKESQEVPSEQKLSNQASSQNPADLPTLSEQVLNKKT